MAGKSKREPKQGSRGPSQDGGSTGEDDTISSPNDGAELEALRVTDSEVKGQKAPPITAQPRAAIHRETSGGTQWPPGFSPEAGARKIREAVEGWGTTERNILTKVYAYRRGT